MEFAVKFLDGFESFVGVNFWTMIFAWCNLLILYILMKKFLFGPIKGMIDKRQSEVDEMYTSAEEAERRAHELEAEYTERLSTAKEESEEIVRAAQRRAQLRSEEIIKEAEADADRIKERAGEEIELERIRAVNEIKDEVSEMAISIAEAVIERDISEEEHRSLIDSFIDQMGDEK
ncbi:MAG: F0F1 ATP synthase subunit B [Clostridia bacterium]|nr:F0F1 ATP synthase subunit B [Clostridia bacterium]